MRYDLECPYCGKELVVNHDEGQNYEQDTLHEMECSECEKNFVFTTYMHFSYEAKKADCLNDNKHNWEITRTVPVELSRMRCTMCDKERPMTDEERSQFGIRSVLEYFDSLKIKRQK